MTSRSPVYTTDHASSVLRTHSWRSAANSAGYLIPRIRPDMTILDVGCGPGSMTIDFACLVPQGHAVGVEYVPEPTEQARALASARGVSNVSFEVGDIHSLPFPDNKFDVVHAHQVLQHISDPVQALREMRRVVKPGGLVACRESASMTWYPSSKGLEAWNELSTKMRRTRGGNPEPGSYIHIWAEKAGFEKAKITKSAGAWCFSSDEEREYWGGSMEERTKSSGFAKIALDEGFSTQEELEMIAASWNKFRQDADAWFGLLHGEILCCK